ncbi:Tetratricopeptide TPR_2 repeat protein [Oscillochloris trichoides DG-6]|uniref:Tetratricopeptide TPR_2 repeat protein n=1 Tax=Oscillochloris trichoides DG-6 TaxID=765420 RepID=E1ID65_9CHLR|nr:Tetratricopeptide TPR_2 repeat protein [Oscillochloris trichoides DG-6]
MNPSSHENLEISLTPTATGYALMLRLMERNLSRGPFAVSVEQSSDLKALFVGEAGQALRECHAAVTGSGNDLHVRLLLPPDLHRLRWEELLLSPVTQKPMAWSGDQWLSRYLSGEGYRPVVLRPKGNLRALIAVAAPTPTPRFPLGIIDADQQIAQVVAALAQIPHTILGDTENSRTTWDRLADTLRDGYDILYLVAHGRFINGEPVLYLVDESNVVVSCTGSQLADLLESLGARVPRLVVLTACEGAGDGYSDALAALGPRLVRAGVPAVLAMQGTFSMASNQRFVGVFFRELLRDGIIARAVNMARQAIQNYPDWWMPVLYTHLPHEVLWEAEKAITAPPVSHTDPAPLVFMSYNRFDDEFEAGAITRLRAELARTLQFLSGETITIFQDTDAIRLGQNIQQRVDNALARALLFIPIITPGYLKSAACRVELQAFLQREQQLGRNDLILPIAYQRVVRFDALVASDPLLAHLSQRLMLDWQQLRGLPFTEPRVRSELERVAEQIISLLDAVGPV